MSEVVAATLPLRRWQGEKAVYHLVTFKDDHAQTLSTHAVIERLEFGRRRGFGSIKVIARIGETAWKTSVFPQGKSSEWILLVSKKVMRAQNLCAGDEVRVTLDLL